jgi:hypothetical protein
MKRKRYSDARSRIERGATTTTIDRTQPFGGLTPRAFAIEANRARELA